MNAKKYIKSAAMSLLVLVLLLFAAAAVSANAEPLSCQTGTAHGSYRDPQTQQIEDSGGESNEALGQSMVENVVLGPALLESAPNGGYYLSVRYGLMNNISSTAFSVQYPGDTDWAEVQSVKTGETTETADLRVAVKSADAILRAEFYVDAMGRSVVFYVTADSWTEGNTENFAQMDSADAESSDDFLSSTQGLVIGGGNTAAAQTQPASTTGSSKAEPAGETGELTLSGSVWLMLFCVQFSAVFLAGGALLLLRGLICTSHRSKSGSKAAAFRQSEVSEEAEEDPMDISLLLDEADWEVPDEAED